MHIERERALLTPYLGWCSTRLNTPATWPCAAVAPLWWSPRQLFHLQEQAPWTNVKQSNNLERGREKDTRWAFAKCIDVEDPLVQFVIIMSSHWVTLKVFVWCAFASYSIEVRFKPLIWLVGLGFERYWGIALWQLQDASHSHTMWIDKTVPKGQKSIIKCNQSVWSTVKATWMGAAMWATVGLQFVVIAKAQSKVNSQVLWVTYQSMKWADQVFLCYCAWDYVDSLVVGFGGIYHKLCHIAPLTWCTQGNRRTTQQYCTVLPQTGVVCMLRWLVIVKHLFYPKRSPKRHQHQETVWESQ